MSENKYIPSNGDFAGQKGIMVERIANPSYNDIKLEFPSGDRRWYKFSDVTLVQPEPEPEPEPEPTPEPEEPYNYKSMFYKTSWDK
jgi:hypothetical protein